MGKVGNIDHLEGKARVEVFDVAAKKSVVVFESDKFKGLVNRLEFAADGAWLLGAGGAGDGFYFSYDPAAKKAGRQEKVAMHVHDFAADGESVLMVGHNKLSLYDFKG